MELHLQSVLADVSVGSLAGPVRIDLEKNAVYFSRRTQNQKSLKSINTTLIAPRYEFNRASTYLQPSFVVPITGWGIDPREASVAVKSARRTGALI